MAAGSIDAGAPGIDEGVEQAGFPVVKQLESFDFKAILNCPGFPGGSKP